MIDLTPMDPPTVPPPAPMERLEPVRQPLLVGNPSPAPRRTSRISTPVSRLIDSLSTPIPPSPHHSSLDVIDITLLYPLRSPHSLPSSTSSNTPVNPTPTTNGAVGDAGTVAGGVAGSRAGAGAGDRACTGAHDSDADSDGEAGDVRGIGGGGGVDGRGGGGGGGGGGAGAPIPSTTTTTPLLTYPAPTIVSNNLNGLSYYGTNTSRRRAMSKHLKTFRGNHHICLQETHLAADEAVALKPEFPDGCISYNNKTTSSGGTAIIDLPGCLAHYIGCDVPLPPLLKGAVQLRRYFPRDPTSGRLPYQLFNVYLYTGKSKNAKMAKQIAAMNEIVNPVRNGLPVYLSFLVGDLNFIELEKDTTGLAVSRLLSGPSQSLWNEFTSRFGLREVPSDLHTHFHIGTDSESWSTRLDRMFVPSSELYASLFVADVSIIFTKLSATAYSASAPHADGTRTFPLSTGITDHLPIKLHVHPSSRQKSRLFPLQGWIFDTPAFLSLFHEKWARRKPMRGPYQRLKQFKAIIREAAIAAKDVHFKPVSDLAKLSTAMALARLITVVSQPFEAIRLLLARAPVLQPLISRNSHRYVDNGLFAFIEELLVSESAPSEFDSPVVLDRPKFNLVSELKRVLPSTRMPLAGLRLNRNDQVAVILLL